MLKRQFLRYLLPLLMATACRTGPGKDSAAQDFQDGAPLLRPSLDPYASYMGVPALPTGGRDDSGVRVTFLGTTTLLFSDGETAWMTDGFFTRPNLLQVGTGEIHPDEQLVRAGLSRANVKSLAAVIAIHSHHDHAMDSPLVAKTTGAKLVGSASTAQIGRGFGLAEEQIQTVKAGDVLTYGRFKITIVASAHSPNPHFPGDISTPLVPPAPASAYKVGDCYTLLVEHDGRFLLVHGSAGFIPGALHGLKAEMVFLGTGVLGKQDAAFREQYWRETVASVGAKRVVAVHWDDFYLPLSHPLVAPLWVLDKLPTALDDLISRAGAEKREFYIPRAYDQMDPFSGLKSH